MVVIEAKNLSAGYRGGTIWQGANFTVRRGEFIGLLGANGAGKSTLFKLLLGLSRPQSGQLSVFGGTPTRGNPRIGYVPQRRFIDSDSRIQAIEYVRLGTYGNKWGVSLPSNVEHEYEAARQALELVDGIELASKPLSKLSGGEVQRVFLAQALVGSPELLLLDEPLANLDIRREHQLTRLVHSITKSQNVTVILIAHDINPLLPVASRIIYIANGKIASGKVDDIVTSKTLSDLYDAPVEVLRDSHGRVAVLGVEEAIHHDD